VTVFWLQLSERGLGARVVPIQGPLVIGRDCDGLRVDDPTVSRRHLAIEPRHDLLVCIDLGSANGTFVDGRRIGRQPVPLSAGSHIRLGESELVVHHGRDTAPGPRPDPQGPGDPHERPSEGVRDLGRGSARRPQGPRQY
jgi:pSer/pThr/pTyr-binding forkhead associated (FHA) protein